MSAAVAIYRGLMGKLDALVFDPPIDIALPNSIYEPRLTDDDVGTHGVPYLRPTLLLPDEIASTGLGDSANVRHQGTFQVDVFVPVDTGEVKARTYAQSIASHFKRGTVIDETDVEALGDLHVRIIRPPTIGNAQREDAWMMIPVRIRWFCDAPNA